MAFNWAGAASGAYEGLQDAIRQRMVEQEFQQRQEALREQQEWRRLQAEVNQQNASSLAESRKAVAEEKKAKSASLAARQTEAMQTVQSGGQNVNLDWIEDPEEQKRTRAYYVARANHYLRTGEELPDAVTSSYFAQPKEKPAYVAMTPEEKADFEWKQRTELRLSPTMNAPDRTAAGKKKWDQKYGPAELPHGPQRWIAGVVDSWSRNTSAGAYQKALSQLREEFDAQQAAGNPYLEWSKVFDAFQKAWTRVIEGGSAKADAMRLSQVNRGQPAIPGAPR